MVMIIMSRSYMSQYKAFGASKRLKGQGKHVKKNHAVYEVTMCKEGNVRLRIRIE
jgi:ribosomal protein L44E